MANDFVPITATNNARAEELVHAINHTRLALQNLRKVKGKFDHHVADPDYSGLEGSSAYGVPTSQGQTVYNIVAGALARVDHADVLTLINRLGQ